MQSMKNVACCFFLNIFIDVDVDGMHTYTQRSANAYIDCHLSPAFGWCTLFCWFFIVLLLLLALLLAFVWHGEQRLTPKKVSFECTNFAG